MGIDYQTKGAKVPAVKDFRQRANKLSGGLNTEQLQTGVKSYNTKAETNGYKPLQCVRVTAATSWKDQIAEPLKKKRWICLWINYGWVNDNVPRLSGDKAFRGTHCVGLLGIRDDDTVGWQIKVFDPLYDGRRAGIPKGPQWWSTTDLKKAAAAVTGAKEGRCGIQPPSSKADPA
jgi:hypothetical protein